MNKERDLRWLQHAVDLSSEALPSENRYRVGCIIVGAGGEVLSSGFTGEGAAEEHAEEAAIRKALTTNTDLRRTTLYSSLEPCSKRLSGRRSCSSRIIDAGISRVVYALKEPALFVDCSGTEELRAAGIEVAVLDALAQAVLELNGHLLTNKH